MTIRWNFQLNIILQRPSNFNWSVLSSILTGSKILCNCIIFIWSVFKSCVHPYSSWQLHVPCSSIVDVNTLFSGFQVCSQSLQWEPFYQVNTFLIYKFYIMCFDYCDQLSTILEVCESGITGMQICSSQLLFHWPLISFLCWHILNQLNKPVTSLSLFN